MPSKKRDISNDPYFILFANRFPKDLPLPSFPRTKENTETFINLTRVLSGVIKTRELRKDKRLNYFLELAGWWRPRVEDGKIVMKHIVTENNPPVFVAVTLMEFLQDEANIARLRKCPFCGELFLATVHNQRYCDPRCKRQVNQPPEENAERMREYRKALKKAARRRKPPKSAVRDSLCQHYKECYEKAAYTNRLLDCRNCKRYEDSRTM
jgi:hypothetical protein